MLTEVQVALRGNVGAKVHDYHAKARRNAMTNFQDEQAHENGHDARDPCLSNHHPPVTSVGSELDTVKIVNG